MMWPISRAALSANASERLMTLATPKKDFQLDHPLSCNRYKNRIRDLTLEANRERISQVMKFFTIESR